MRAYIFVNAAPGKPAEVVQQLRGCAGANQIANAHIGMAQNLGATGATAVTHILMRDE